MSLLTLTADTSSLRLHSERVLVSSADGVETEIPLCEITRVVVVGQPHITFNAVREFLRRHCPVVFLSHSGRFLGSLGRDEHFAERLKAQTALSLLPDKQLNFCKFLIAAKLKNQRRVLSRLSARRGNHVEISAALSHLKSFLHSVFCCHSLNELRGIEGSAAGEYFNALNVFLPPEFQFKSRTRQPPLDAFNALLSLGYTMTAGEIDVWLRLHGLESCLGIMHHSHGAFPALAWDLLEIFRAPFCDMLAVKLVNHRQLQLKHFETNADSGAVKLRFSGRKIFFAAYEKRLDAPFSLPASKETTSYRRQIEAQVLLLLKILDGREHAVEFFQMP